MAIDEIKRSLQEKLAGLSIEQLQEVDTFIDRINLAPANEYDYSLMLKTLLPREEMF